jgi:hypothetical protein
LLAFLLSRAEFPGRDELLQQVDGVDVAGGPVTMIDLVVSAGLPAASVADGPIPLSAVVTGADGNTVGEILVWVTGGHLSTLEFAWWSEQAPAKLPSADDVTVGTVPG